MITKAIIPVAGIGTRFLPASKSIPKEMFPLVDKPVIQYIVEEAVASGIKDIIFVTSSSKQSLENFFGSSAELESYLIKKNKARLVPKVRNLAKLANFSFIRQTKPKGDGDAISRARHLLSKNEAVLVAWGDDVIVGKSPVAKQLIDLYARYKSPIFAVEKVKRHQLERYGVISGKKVAKNVYSVSHIVEKPAQEEAPSDLAIVGRYILTRDVLEELSRQTPAVDGEIRTSEALRDVIKQTQLYAYKFSGKRFDCGSKLGWLSANVYLGLRDEEIGKEFQLFLKEIKILSEGSS